ncbi:NUDIX domain-containing protein [bacterium]|nr:NUDIX domain-containing protein [bacterium]
MPALTPEGLIMRVVVLVTRGGGANAEVLVFNHCGHPEHGTQVVGGTVNVGEEPRAAAHRELAEESGIVAAHELEHLGRLTHPECGEVRDVYRLTGQPGLAEAWRHVVTGGDKDCGMVFFHYWLAVKTARELLGFQAQWLDVWLEGPRGGARG